MNEQIRDDDKYRISFALHSIVILEIAIEDTVTGTKTLRYGFANTESRAAVYGVDPCRIIAHLEDASLTNYIASCGYIPSRELMNNVDGI